MAKSKSKPKETVLLIRIPDAEARRGEASLTIQRGDLGHLTQFNYTGLTLRGNIAEAVQVALIALAKLEAAPPPKFNTTPAQAETAVTTDTSTAENESDVDDDEVDTTDVDEGEEGEESSEVDDNDKTAPAEVNLSATPEASAAEPSAHTTSASRLMSALPDNTAQMSLF